jgi:hypothetical protein
MQKIGDSECNEKFHSGKLPSKQELLSMNYFATRRHRVVADPLGVNRQDTKCLLPFET